MGAINPSFFSDPRGTRIKAISSCDLTGPLPVHKRLVASTNGGAARQFGQHRDIGLARNYNFSNLHPITGRFKAPFLAKEVRTDAASGGRPRLIEHRYRHRTQVIMRQTRRCAWAPFASILPPPPDRISRSWVMINAPGMHHKKHQPSYPVSP